MAATQPAAALAEMVRMTRADGWVVVRDMDWGTRSHETEEVQIERRRDQAGDATGGR